jgi:hypothetical protein
MVAIVLAVWTCTCYATGSNNWIWVSDVVCDVGHACCRALTSSRPRCTLWISHAGSSIVLQAHYTSVMHATAAAATANSDSAPAFVFVYVCVCVRAHVHVCA